MLCPCRRRPFQNPRQRSVYPRAGTLARAPLDQRGDDAARIRRLCAGQADEKVADRFVADPQVPPALVSLGEARPAQQRDPRELRRREPPVDADHRLVAGPRGVPKERQHDPGVVRLVGNHAERRRAHSDRAPVADPRDTCRATDGHVPQLELGGPSAPLAGTAQTERLIVPPRRGGQTARTPESPIRRTRDPQDAVMGGTPETRVGPGRALRFHVAVRCDRRVDRGGHRRTGTRGTGTPGASAPPPWSLQV